MTADVTAVIKSKKSPFSAMFTARYFRSDEQDLSDIEDYDYAQVADNSISYLNQSESIFLGTKIESQDFTMGFGYWFKENNIEIPYPQSDLHIRSSDIVMSSTEPSISPNN
jgi:hypothetical protein